MNREEFVKKWDERDVDVSATDVLSRIASNLSDLQEEGLDVGAAPFSTVDVGATINNLKQYIFDYQKVIRNEKSKEYDNL